MSERKVTVTLTEREIQAILTNRIIDGKNDCDCLGCSIATKLKAVIEYGHISDD